MPACGLEVHRACEHPLRHDDTTRLDADIRPQQTSYRAREQSAGTEKDDGESDLRDTEQGTNTDAARNATDTGADGREEDRNPSQGRSASEKADTRSSGARPSRT